MNEENIYLESVSEPEMCNDLMFWGEKLGAVGGAIIGNELANCILPNQMNPVLKSIARVSAIGMCSALAGDGMRRMGHATYTFSKFIFDMVKTSMSK